MSQDPFLDVYLPEGLLGMPISVGPRFSTKIVLAKSGDEGRNRNWKHPLRKFALPEAVNDQRDFEDATDHWLIMGGPEHTFPFRDPLEFASVALEDPNTVPAISGRDQPLGVGDGLTYKFQMIRRRTLAGLNYDRPIYLPILDTVLILMDGVAPGAVSGGSGGPYTVEISRPGGIVTFSPVPHAGIVLTCGYLFDTEVRWEADDSFDAIVHSLETAGAAPLDFVETRREGQ